MKNVSRNKFLHCFRPVVDVDFVLESKGDADDHPNKKASKNSESLIIVQPPKRTFSQVIKAVVFETILAKRVRDRKGLSRSKRSVSINSQRSLASIDDKSVNRISSESEIQEIKSNPVLSISSSTSYCSSSISDPKNLTKSLSDKKKNTNTSQNKQQEGKVSSNFKTGIYSLLISLTLTVLWGKVCAILVTSLWFYFVPNRPAGSDICQPEYVTKLAAKTESRDYKKRVIMEGLLERKPPQRGIKSLT